MCQQLGITRAVYYKWLHREIPDAEQENILLAQLIQEYDNRFNHILGYRRMTLYINHFSSKHYSRNHVHRIMKALNIHSAIRRKPKKYQHSNPETTAENILNRDFNAKAPNEKWAKDVTEFKWYEGPVVHKLYLSAILDLYDLYPVAWVVSTRNDNKLVFDTFAQAVQRYPDAKPIIHSDRGFQYTSKAFQNMLKKQDMAQSMSRVGHCIDRGPAENFWGIVKSEMYYLSEFRDETALREAIASYMNFYATERIQVRLDGKTPAEVRAKALASDSPDQYPIPVNKRIQNTRQSMLLKQNSCHLDGGSCLLFCFFLVYLTRGGSMLERVCFFRISGLWITFRAKMCTPTAQVVEYLLQYNLGETRPVVMCFNITPIYRLGVFGSYCESCAFTVSLLSKCLHLAPVGQPVQMHKNFHDP